MAKKTTIISFVLDETGSMLSVRLATISGFNEYVDEIRKNKKGPVRFSLTTFNSIKIATVLDHVELKDVPKLTGKTYNPTSLTPLYDAVAQSIGKTKKRVKTYKTKPSVLCVIMTDGYENASKEYTREAIFELVKEMEGKGWTFAYLGANQDAWAVAESIGVAKASAMNYDPTSKGTSKAIRRAASATSSYMANDSQQTSDFFKGKEHVDDEPEKVKTGE
ncbi:hypothetical protein LCGC14_1605890 [marine sediment metagenome]|uniref:VWFA domain-containing protein n=1 Tax=marine sediment metagenome TaxID=412755 RepID=A0A0F9I9S1_9ZZZZ